LEIIGQELNNNAATGVWFISIWPVLHHFSPSANGRVVVVVVATTERRRRSRIIKITRNAKPWRNL
jgi:hypothetical protein